MSTVETIRFRIKDSVAEESFREINSRVELEYMKKRAGFVSRETLLSPDGEWLVIVHWADAAAAEATIGAFFGAPETQEFIAAVDTSTVAPGRYQPVEA